MFDPKSDYALNKRSQNIVCRQADGTYVEITPEDCPDFERWKAFSDGDYHARELDGRRIVRDCLPLNEDICGCVDDYFDEAPPDSRTMENAMDILEQCLTETQRRRYLLHNRDGLTTRQIAQAEGVSQHAIMTSLHESEKKLKKFRKSTFSERPENGDR